MKKSIFLLLLGFIIPSLINVTLAQNIPSVINIGSSLKENFIKIQQPLTEPYLKFLFNSSTSNRFINIQNYKPQEIISNFNNQTKEKTSYSLKEILQIVGSIVSFVLKLTIRLIEAILYILEQGLTLLK